MAPRPRPGRAAQGAEGGGRAARPHAGDPEHPGSIAAHTIVEGEFLEVRIPCAFSELWVGALAYHTIISAWRREAYEQGLNLVIRSRQRKNAQATWDINVWLCIGPPKTVAAFYSLFYNSLLETSPIARQTLPHPSTVRIRELGEGGRMPSGTDQGDADAAVTAIQERVRDLDETLRWGAPAPAAEDTPRRRPCPAAASGSGSGASASPQQTALGQATPRASASSPRVATRSNPDDDWMEEHFAELQALFDETAQAPWLLMQWPSSASLRARVWRVEVRSSRKVQGFGSHARGRTFSGSAHRLPRFHVPAFAWEGGGKRCTRGPLLLRLQPGKPGRHPGEAR